MEKIIIGMSIGWVAAILYEGLFIAHLLAPDYAKIIQCEATIPRDQHCVLQAVREP